MVAVYARRGLRADARASQELDAKRNCHVLNCLASAATTTVFTFARRLRWSPPGQGAGPGASESCTPPTPDVWCLLLPWCADDAQ